MRPTAAIVLCLALGAGMAQAETDDTLYNIIRPERGTAERPEPKFEPWLAPKYKTPRSVRPPVMVAPSVDTPRRSEPPPPIMVPETGRLLPHLPDASRSETAQDRALRCAHQAGVYGQAAGNRNAYIGSCINQ